MVALEPRRRVKRLPVGTRRLGEALAQRGICGHLLEPTLVDALQQEPGIPGGAPDLGIDRPPKLACTGVGGHSEIERELRKSFETLGQRRR